MEELMQQKMNELMKNLAGVPVNKRAAQVKQPRGGYVNIKQFDCIELEDEEDKLNESENVGPGLIGMAVDYMTRFMTGTPVGKAFDVSIIGADNVNESAKAKKLMSEITGIDDTSVINALKLSGFDVACRSSINEYKPVDEINPDISTINNVRIMINRSMKFFEQYGPKLLDGFTFEGGYTKTVSAGDGDFITEDTLWDFKTGKTPLNKNNTLQLIMYWRMGLRSTQHSKFINIKYLGIYNPRINKVYRISVEDISDEIISEIDRDVIGYDNTLV